MLTRSLAILLLLFSWNARTSDTLPTREEAKRIVATLASRPMWGRGYTRGGMERAARFLEGELRSAGLAPLDGKSYRQDFEYAVNTFPGAMRVEVNGKKLKPGVDYIVATDCPGIEASGTLTETDATTFEDPSRHVFFGLKDKLTWSVGRKVAEDARIWIDRKRFPEKPQRYRVKIQNEFVERFHASNLAAIVPGTESPDSYVVMGAHYDHLGGMGRHAYFPGANDNASGVSLLLSLAKYYVAHPQKKSLVFLFFAGEEAGLVGSKWFVEHPLVDLSKIRFLTNFDLAGTGEDGITAVNATEFPDEFSLLKAANEREGSFKAVNPRGKAAISDHYWFSERGVPAFFLYTLGGIAAYHDVFDRSKTLPMNKFEEYVRLVIRFNSALMEK